MGVVDFDAARQSVRLADVLGLLGWSHRERERSDLLGWCPLCGEGKGWRRCFRVREERWVCYRCQRSGGAFDLWTYHTRKAFPAALKDLFRRLGRPLPYKPRSRTRRD